MQQFNNRHHLLMIKIIRYTITAETVLKIILFAFEVVYYIKFYLKSKKDDNVQLEIVENIEKTRITDKKLID